MSTCEMLLTSLRSGAQDGALARLYALDGSSNRLTQARQRAIRVVEGFQLAFDPSSRAEVALFSAPGRTEIGGNHTDHQHGRVLAAAVDLDFLACAAPNGTNVIRFQSEGWPLVEVTLDSLEPLEEERESTAALVRGDGGPGRRDGLPRLRL